MKKIFFFVTIFICFTGTISFGSALFSDLLQTYEYCSDFQEELKTTEYQRVEAIRDFLEKHIGKDFVAKNKTQIFNMAKQGDCAPALKQMLEPSISDSNERNKLVNGFSWPRINNFKIDQIWQNLESMLFELRVPTSDGYKYAEYSKSVYVSLEKQKLVAQHEIGQFQSYTRTVVEPLFRIHMYSPQKNGLVTSNRDVFLDTLSIKYAENGSEKVITEKFNRYLKRGESFDYELPKIITDATINLTFATKKEHKGKAIFYVEPILAGLVDDISSPYAGLIAQIQSFKSCNSITNLRYQFNNLRSALKTAMIANVEQKNTFLNNGPKLTTASTLPIKADHIKYFHFLLLDKSNSRDDLTEKFKQLFMHDD